MKLTAKSDFNRLSDMNKIAFLKHDLFSYLKNIHADTQSKWGKMNPRQMLEHLIDFINLSTEKIHFPLAVPEADLPKYKAFLMSDKPFRENTKAPATVLGEEPLPVKLDSIEIAVAELEKSIDEFFRFFSENPDKKTLHPAFGLLNFEEWLMLHVKHVTHHLRQFELITDN